MAKGQFSFNDHAAGVQFHVDEFHPQPFGLLGRVDVPTETWAFIATYEGTYTCNAGTGALRLGVSSDTMETAWGDQNADAVFVSIMTGPYEGYENIGLVQGGKIQFKPAK